MKIYQLVLFSAVLLLGASSAVYAQPAPPIEAEVELVEESLDYSAPSEPSFPVGQKTKIVVMVKNSGNKKLDPVDVGFYADDQLIGEVNVGPLLPGEEKLAVIFWIPTDPGQHNIHAVGDHRRLFDERDEGNNWIDRVINIDRM